MNEARRGKNVVSKIIIYVILSLWALTTIYPIYWVILNSFRKKQEIRHDSFSIPMGDSFTLDNYETAFDRLDIFSSYLRSLIISFTVVIAIIVFAGLAAYALARYNFFGKRLLNNIVVMSMMFPAFATIIPVFRMMFDWGIVNTGNVGLSLMSVILPQIAGNLSFAIIILTGYIRGMPIELEEAAYIEGYSLGQIFFKIIIPVAKPCFATVAIFSFLWSYNDLFTQMFFLRYRNTYTITRLLNEIASIAGVNYGLMCAAVVLVVVPVLIVYIFLQKYIIKGLTAGAVKG